MRTKFDAICYQNKIANVLYNAPVKAFNVSMLPYSTDDRDRSNSVEAETKFQARMQLFSEYCVLTFRLEKLIFK